MALTRNVVDAAFKVVHARVATDAEFAAHSTAEDYSVLLGTLYDTPLYREQTLPIARLYSAILGRDPEPAGLSYYVNQIRDGSMTLSSAAWGFLHSPEAAGRFNFMALDDRAFIETLYRVTLGREAEEGGLAYYLYELAHVRGRDSVAVSFSLSPENIARVGNKEFAAYAPSAADGLDLDPPASPTQLALSAEDDTGVSSTDGITSQTSGLTITGQAEAGATVIIFSASGAELAWGVADGSGGFAIDIDLAGGTHTLGVVAKDGFGNRSVAGSLTLQVTTTPPGAPTGLALDPGDDTGTSSTDRLTRKTDLTITGEAATGSFVTLSDSSGKSLGSGIAADGRFSIEVKLAAGTHLVFARSSDAGGNASALSSALQIEVDTTAPEPVSGLRLAEGDSGISSSDGVTSSGRGLVVTAAAEAGTTVVLYATDGITELGRAVSIGGTATVTLDLTEGIHFLGAAATDAAGNRSSASQALRIEVDMTAPGAPASVAESDSSDLADGLMNAAEAVSTSFRVMLPVTEPLTRIGDRVELLLDSRPFDAPKIHVLTAIDMEHGWVNFKVASADLGADGSKSLGARITDPAGNTGARTSLAFMLDTLAPGAPAVADPSGSTVDGVLDPFEAGAVFRVSLPPGAGGAVAGDSLQLLLGGAPLGVARTVTLSAQNVIDGHVDFTVSRADLGADGVKSITAQVTDRAGNIGPASGAWVFTLDSNKPPVVTPSAGSTAWVEDGPATAIDGAIGVIDEDSPVLTGATVRISGGFEAGDRLEFTDGAGITGHYDGLGILTLSGSASPAAYQAALRSIQFLGTSQSPTASKTISWTVNDGEKESAAVFKTISGTPVNDAPVIGPSSTASYTENGAPVMVSPLATVSDVDSSNFDGGSLTVGFTANGTASDQLAISNTGTGAGQIGVSGSTVRYGGQVIGTWSGGSDGANLLVTFTSAAATPAAVQALARAVTYANSSDNPSGLARTVTFTLVDGDGKASGGADTGSATATVLVTPVNDAPVLTSTAAHLAFTEGDPETAIDPGLTVADADHANLAGAQVTISSGFQSGDRLVFADQNGIAGSYEAASGVLTLTGVSTVANYQAALASVKFQTTNDPATPKTISWKVNDGALDSNTAVRTIDITAVNDAPVFMTASDFATITEDAQGNAGQRVSSLFTSTDADGPTAANGVAVYGQSGGSGRWQYSLDGSAWSDIGAVAGGSALLLRSTDWIRFVPDGRNADNASIAFYVWDRTQGSAGTKADVATRGGATAYSLMGGNSAITVTSVNDAPTLSGTAGALTCQEGATLVIDAAVVVADVDNEDASLASAQVRISGNFQAGDLLQFVDQNGITGAYDANTGVLTLTGPATQAHWQTALRSVSFTTGGNDAPATTKDIEWEISDGTAASNVVSYRINLTPVNDAPVIDLVAGGGIDSTALTATFTENGPALAVLADIALADPDSSNFTGATVTLANMQPDDVLAVNGSTTGNLAGVSWTVTGNVVSFSGTASQAAYQAALRLLTFVNTSDHPSTVPRTFAVVVDDGGAVSNQSAVATATVNLVAVNDAPVFTSASTASVAEGTTSVLTLAATDAEGATITYALAGGADQARFTLIGNQLSFVAAPGFGNPQDAGANNIYDVRVSASDGTDSTSQDIAVTVTNLPPSVPVDGDAAANHVSRNAPAGTLVHVDADAADPAGSTVTYSLADDAGGRFAIDAATGVVTVLGAIVHDTEDDAKNHVPIKVRATDASGAYSEATFTITIIPNSPPVASDNAGAATEPGGNANATPGTDATGNVITDVPADADNEDAVGLLVVSAIGLGSEANPGAAGTVGQALQGQYGTLTISATGAYTYKVDANNAAVDQLQAGGATLVEHFHYTVTDTGGASDTATLSITISGQNDAPQTAGAIASGFEDQPNATQTSPIQVVLTGSDVDGTVAFFKVTALPASGVLYTDAALTVAVTQGASMAAAAGALSLYYKPAANAYGVDSFTFAAIDDSGAEDGTPATATVTVTAVNDAPGFTLGGTQTVLEDAGPQSVPGFVGAISAGPANESAQTVSFTVTNDNAALFSVQPAIDATGRLTYTPAANANGAATVTVFASDDGGTENGGVASSAPRTFTINVTAVNDAPSFTAGANQVVLEDSGAQSVANFVSAMSAGPADEAGQAVSFTVTNNRNDLFSVQPAIDASGRLTYTPKANAFGTATVTVSVSDNGGVANGGSNTSASQTFTIELTPQPDVPFATDDALAAINEDSGPVVVATAAGLMSNDFDVDNFPNTGSNSGLTFSGVSNGTNGTVSYDSVTGNVTFTPNANYNGVASFDYTIADGTGRTDTATATFTVNAVNDAPVNANAGSSQLVVFSNTAKALTGLSISDVDAGAAVNITTTLAASDGAKITVGNGVSGTNAGITGGATVATNGSGSVVLTGSVAQINLTLAGSNVTYVSADGFTTAAGSPSTITITTNDAGNTGLDPGLSGSGTSEADVDVIQVGVLPQVWFIDSTPPATTSGPAGSQTNPFTSIEQFNTASAAAGGPGANDYIYIETGTYAGPGINLKAGQTLLGADQALSFADPFGGPAIVISAGGGTRPTIAVTTVGDQGIALSTDNVVRGINITTAAGTVGVEDGGGTVSNLVMSAVRISGGGKAIDIDQGGTLGNVVFESVGSTASASEVIDLQGLSGTLTINGGIIGGAMGAAVNIAGTSTLNVNFNGVSISQANNSALLNVAGNHTGAITFDSFSALTATHGTGLQFSNADGTYTFNGTTTLNGASQGDAGIDIVGGSGGTFTFGSGTSINNSFSANAAFQLTDSNATVTYSGSITDNNGRAVNIDGHDGGTVTFQTGSISASGGSAQGIRVANSNAGSVNFNGQATLSTGANTAVDLSTGNAGGTVSFNAAGNGLDIVTSTGRGFDASGGGTVSVAGPGNSIVSAGGIALNVVNTTIGAADLNFASISANGGTSGIVLNNTGTSGGLNISGSGTTANSGGIIQNTSGNAISVTNAIDLNLNLMNVTNPGGHGIWLENLGGVNTISKTTIENFNTVNTAALWWQHGATATSTLNLDAVRVANQTNSNGGSAVVVRTYAGGNLDFNVIDSNTADTFKSEFVNLFGSAINLSAGDAATDGFAVDVDVVVTNTTFRDSYVSGIAGGSSNLEMTAAGMSHLDYTIQNNTFSNIARGNASAIVGIINLNTHDRGTVGYAGDYSVIANNTITNIGTSAAIAEAGYIGIRLAFDNSSAVNNYVGITGNTITDVWRQGVLLSSRDKAIVDAVIQGNTVGNTAVGAVGLSNQRAVEIETQATSVMYVSILNNAIHGAGTADASAALGITAGATSSSTSTLNATVAGNTITNINSANTSGYFRAQTANVSNNQATLNLDLTGNILPDNAKTYAIVNNGGTIKVEGTGSGAVTSSSIQAANASGVGGITGAVTYNNGSNVPQPTYNPLLAESMLAPAPGDQPDTLTAQQLADIVDAAVQRWALAGLNTEQLRVIEGVKFAVVDLQGTHLGVSIGGGVVLIDSDAAGWGWFVDATPMDDSEYIGATPAAAARHMDLLSVVVHELGHLLGFEDTHGESPADGLMHAYLQAGERRVPVADFTEMISPDLLVGVAPPGAYGEAGL